MSSLQLPPTTSSLVIASATAAPATGKAKLEAKFLSMLEDTGVDATICDKLGNAGCTSSGLFGGITGDEKEMVMYLKAVGDLDVLARADDFLPRARLLIVWKACTARQEIEVQHTAQRAVENLPPQTTDQDFGLQRSPSKSSRSSRSWTTRRHPSRTGSGRWARWRRASWRSL